MAEFNGIVLIDTILALPDLNLTEKVLLSHIIGLSINQTCNAGNKYMAEKIGITETTVSTSLKSLKSKGYLDTKVFPERYNYREIYLNIKGDTLFKFLKDPLTNSYIPYLNSLSTLFKNFNAPIESKEESIIEKENINPLTPKGESGEQDEIIIPGQSLVEAKVLPLEKEKKKKIPPVAPPPPEYPYGEPFLDAWCEWEAFRAENKWPKYKPIGLQGALNGLAELAGKSEQKAIAIIKRSIAKGWRGFFPLLEIEQKPLQSFQKPKGYSQETTIQAGLQVMDELSYIDEQRRIYPDRYYKHAVKGWLLRPEFANDNAA